ncbi:MAG: hypothetical protein Q9195_006182 [Heterodermia aff. obscurata]
MQPEIGSPEAGDDKSNVDSISITSTVLSQHSKDHKYPLEAILAEKKFRGVTKYLVKWEGYPEYRCTWETRAMFQDGEDSTFYQWETQKMRVSRGLSKPFDLPAFKHRVEIWLDGIEDRKLRRRAKRQRIGLPIGPIEIEPDEYTNDSQAEEEDEEPPTGRRRSSLKRKATFISKSLDGSPESDAIDTANSDETSPSVQWTSREEGALMDGLRACKGPNWAQILNIHRQKLKGFNTSDLESRAVRIKASFRESGKEIPLELRDVSDNPSGSNKGTKDEIQPRKNVSRAQSDADKQDRGSETDDSLFEELRMKNEARLRKDRQKPDTYKKTKRPELSRKKASTEGSRSESAKSRPQDAQKAKDTSKETTAKSLGGIAAPRVLPKTKRRPSIVSQGAPKATMTTSRPKNLQAPSASRLGPVTTNVPSEGASKPGPDRPQPKPQSQFGAVGRGPRRAPTGSMFMPKKKKRHATGAAVLANWDTGKTHGNSSLAIKSFEVAEKSDKLYNKHSIARRAVKKGRTEPVPNLEDLQLINPKDGKVVKKVPVATPTSITSKSAYELILERREQENKKSMDDLFDAEPDDMAWMGAVEEELAVTSKVTSRPEAPPAKPMTDFRPEIDIRTTSDVRPTKKMPLSLQAYSQRLEARSAPDSAPAAPRMAPPPDNTAADELRALKLTESKSDVLTGALPANSKSLGLPNSPLSPEDLSAPKQPAQSHLSEPNPLAMELSMKEAAPLVTKTVVSPERPPVVTVPLAPKALMTSGPPPTAGALLAPHPQLAPESVQFLWTHEHHEVYGDILVGPERKSKADINDLSETLKLNVSGAIYLGDHFTMVVFPIGSEDWAFLEQHMPALPPVGLHCIIRSPIQRAVADNLYGTVGVGKGQKITLETEEPAINVIMRNLYGIDYFRLIRQPNQVKEQVDHVFYLLFPKERRDEQDLILHFLDANGAVEVYSYDEDINNGSWEYIYRVVTHNCVIIAHSTFWRFHRMPHFAKCIWHNNLVWSLALRKSERLAHSHLVPLFPHGSMFLITDSLLLLQPLEAIKILLWYRLRIMDEKQGGWKMVMRPNIRRFLLNCCRERKLDEEGRPFVQIYEQIAYMLDPEDLYDWEEDEPKEEAPIYCMKKIKSFNTKVGRRVDYNKDLDHTAIARNDEVLADFFAGWANVHMQYYRRFLIISGFDGDDGKAQRDRWAEKWTYCEAFTPAHFCRRHSVPSQEELDKEAVKRHSSTMAMLRSREADIDANAKAEEADSREQMALIDKDWKAQLDGNPKLREMYEAFVKSGGPEELQLSEDEVAREDRDDDDDEWSNDGSSVPSVEMGEINVDEDEDMVDGGDGESSEWEMWGLSDGDVSGSSGSDSE